VPATNVVVRLYLPRRGRQLRRGRGDVVFHLVDGQENERPELPVLLDVGIIREKTVGRVVPSVITLGGDDPYSCLAQSLAGLLRNGRSK
jgi:hypothetical protein